MNESDLLHALSTEELKNLERRQTIVSDFKRQQLEDNAQRNWDCFYRRNADNFFKDRHWTKSDIEIILNDVDLSRNLVFIEAGCGVGNMLFPLSTYFPQWTLCGFDFSKNALQMLQERAAKLGIRVETHLIDLATSSDAPIQFRQFSAPADILSLIFVLSAISPEKQEHAIVNLRRFLRPGASVVVRDYAKYDHTMLRFGRGTKLADRFYTRQDGTRAYFFEKEELTKLFEEAGFETRQCEYLYRKTVNHKKQLAVDRIFIQGRFVLK